MANDKAFVTGSSQSWRYMQKEVYSKQVDKMVGKAIREWGKVPIVGKPIRSLGRVARIWNHPCAQPAPMLIFAAIGTLPDSLGFVLASLFAPTCTDFAVSRVGAGRGHRKGPTGRRPGPSIDPYKNIEKWMPPAYRFRSKTGIDYWFLRGIELGRLAGWYLTLLEAIPNGLVRWSSATMQLAGCNVPPKLNMHGTIPEQAMIFSDVWLPLTIDWDTPITSGSGPQEASIPAGLNYEITWTAGGHPPDEPGLEDCAGMGINFRLAVFRNSHWQATSPGTVQGGDTGQGNRSHHLGIVSDDRFLTPHSELARVEYLLTDCGLAHCDGGSISVTAIENPNMLTPAECGPAGHSK